MAETEQDKLLDDIFGAARDAAPDMPPALMDRILQDAERMQQAPAPVAAPKAPRGWRRLVQEFGGWPSLTGLAAATLAGVWIGYSGTVQDYVWPGSDTGYDVVDLLPSFTQLIAEGDA